MQIVSPDSITEYNIFTAFPQSINTNLPELFKIKGF
jgi:hypothetical protein